MTKRQPDLTPFCTTAVDHRSYDLSTPFVRDGWLYATDGSIAVRVPATGQPDSGGKRPRVEKLFKGVDFRRCVVPMPRISFTVVVDDDEAIPLIAVNLCGRKWFDLDYIANIAALPGAKYNPLSQGTKGDFLAFTARGKLQGLLMRMSTEGDK